MASKVAAVRRESLPATAAAQRLGRLAAPTAQIAFRVAGIEVRKAFTDSLKRFSEYVDESGAVSSGGRGIYIQLSRRINTTFGLSREAAEQFLTGGSPSLADLCSVVELLTLKMLEIDLTDRMDAGMAAKQPRREIKQGLYDCIDWHGQHYRERVARWRERA